MKSIAFYNNKGGVGKPPASPTPTQAQTEGATYSTEKNNVSDKEDIDEVSDS